MFTWQPNVRVQIKSTRSPEDWATPHSLHTLLHVASLQPWMLTMSSTFPSFQESPKFCFHCDLSLESHHWLRNSTKAGLISVGKIQGTSKTLALSWDPFPGCLGPHSICVLLEDCAEDHWLRINSVLSKFPTHFIESGSCLTVTDTFQ